MRLTVVSHFYNEEFLLPFWLRHHRNLFDHGIMINYQSTDRSCEIIRELVPDWLLVNTRIKKGWVAPSATDHEVEDWEGWASGRCQSGSCWKMALTTTEFLFHWNLHEYVNDLEVNHPELNGVKAHCVRMIDPPELKDADVDFDKHLCLQRTTGWFESQDNHGPTRIQQPRSRLLHRHVTGHYEMGRHSTKHRDVRQDAGLYLLWYNYSPFKYTMPRGIAMRNKQWFDAIAAGQVRDNPPGWTWGPRFPHCYPEQWNYEYDYLTRDWPVHNMVEHDPRYKEIYDKIASSWKW